MLNADTVQQWRSQDFGTEGAQLVNVPTEIFFADGSCELLTPIFLASAVLENLKSGGGVAKFSKNLSQRFYIYISISANVLT